MNCDNCNYKTKQDFECKHWIKNEHGFILKTEKIPDGCPVVSWFFPWRKDNEHRNRFGRLYC
jgi:hypothetical protein